MRYLRTLLLLLACAGIAIPFASAQTNESHFSAQLLDYQKGYIFVTTGDGYRVDPHVAIVQFTSGQPTSEVPAPRDFARLTFSGDGIVTRIELSHKRLPAEGDPALAHRYAIALSTPAPNPDLGGKPQGLCSFAGPAHLVPVRFVVQVPPSTQPTDNVYVTTDQSAWNPQAYRMNRVDALHYETTMRLMSGTDLQYLFDRGSTQSLPRAQNGLEQEPFHLCVRDATVQSVSRQVFHWGDETGSSNVPAPQTMPTPFNPAPFPNLPGATPNPRPTF